MTFGDKEMPTVLIQSKDRHNIQRKINKGHFPGRISTVVELDEERVVDEWNPERMERELHIGNGLTLNEKEQVYTTRGK